mgnify:CR=1 FL=1
MTTRQLSSTSFLSMHTQMDSVQQLSVTVQMMFRKVLQSCITRTLVFSITGKLYKTQLVFQHPVAGTYKKECIEQGKKYFSVASGGGTGRTLHPDNMAAGPASYGMTDTMGRMHSDAQFAGSSSVPAHVEMMGLIGMGNNPMVGATVAVAVSVQQAADAGKF